VTRARVIALGQAAAGDDGVGFRVLDALRARGVPPGVELLRAAEDSALVELLETPAPVVLVDAVLGSPAGEVVELAPHQLADGIQAVSTHGLGVAQALALARTLTPNTVSPSIRIVGVTIERPVTRGWELSAPVAAAVARAVERVLALVADTVER
jgi:hydrogenase maturation protease